MLNNKTYGVWNLTCMLLALAMASASTSVGLSGWYIAGFSIIAIVFASYATMAFAGKGMYRKHVAPETPLDKLLNRDTVSDEKQD